MDERTRSEERLVRAIRQLRRAGQQVRDAAREGRAGAVNVARRTNLEVAANVGEDHAVQSASSRQQASVQQSAAGGERPS